jgi:hypothetical protein
VSSKQRNAEKRRLRHEEILAMDGKPDAQVIVDGFMLNARIEALEAEVAYWKGAFDDAHAALTELQTK